MATATLSYTGPADGQASVTLQHVGTTADALMPYFFAYYRSVYGQVPDTVADPDGSKHIMRDMTDTETYEKWAQGVAAGTQNAVQRYVIDQAKAQAEAQAQQILVTQQS